ncbi:hypothetical protein DMENIID0001_122010 [Sergentomyia squamirostris]
MIIPIWSYGIEIWGSTRESNLSCQQSYQSKSLRMIAGADWYINNECIHRDLEMPTVREKIQNISSRHITRLAAHPNDLAACLPLRRAYIRLKRADPLDLPSRRTRIPG